MKNILIKYYNKLKNLIYNDLIIYFKFYIIRLDNNMK